MDNDRDNVPLKNYSPIRSETRLPPYGSESTDIHDEYPTKYSSQPFNENGKYSKLIEETNDIMEGEETKNRKETGVPKTPKRIDYVLVYDNKYIDEIHDPSDRRTFKKNLEVREKFEWILRNEEGLELQEDKSGGHVYIKIHTPFKRLCKEAEKMKLEMPLAGVSCKYHWQS